MEKAKSWSLLNPAHFFFRLTPRRPNWSFRNRKLCLDDFTLYLPSPSSLPPPLDYPNCPSPSPSSPTNLSCLSTSEGISVIPCDHWHHQSRAWAQPSNHAYNFVFPRQFLSIHEASSSVSIKGPLHRPPPNLLLFTFKPFRSSTCFFSSTVS